MFINPCSRIFFLIVYPVYFVWYMFLRDRFDETIELNFVERKELYFYLITVLEGVGYIPLLIALHKHLFVEEDTARTDTCADMSVRDILEETKDKNRQINELINRDR